MSKRAVLSLVAALVMMVSAAGAALASDPTASTNVSLTITPGSQFSIAITGSNNFPNAPYSLTGPANWTNSAYYNVQVTDLRGTGDGWNVNASASAFTPVVTGAKLQNANNYCNGNWSGPQICYTAGSILNGVAVVAGSPDIVAAPALILKADPGSAPGPLPNGTGVFTTQEVVYYNNFPAGLQAGTYTSTITLTLSSATP